MEQEKWNPSEEAIKKALRPNTIRKWVNTFLIIMFGIFIIMTIFFINGKKEEKKKIAEQEQIQKDSIRQENIKKEKLKKIESERIANEKRITGYTNNSDSKYDIAILITDNNNQIVNDLASKIGSIYKNQGHSITSSFFTTSFIKSKYLNELQNSNSDIIDMLKLNNRIKYIVIGKINYSFRKGTLAEGSSICTAKITIRIISVNQKSIKNEFECSVNGNGTNEDQAKEYAVDKLLSKYISEYSSI